MKPILVVDDNEDDIFLVRIACERSGFPHSFHVAQGGKEAVAYLSGEGKYADRGKYPIPRVLFLDIKMPGMDGHEVLQWIRSQPQFKDLPVVMLTSSDARSDLERAYSLGLNSYLRKGGDLVEFGQGLRVILKYWLELNLVLE